MLLVLGITFFIGISYAFFQITLTQTEENSMITGCFKINFTDENDIHLLESYPISDTEGLALQPYTFTIENICSSAASFQVNLEDITNSTKKLSLEYLKVSLNQTKGNL